MQSKKVFRTITFNVHRQELSPLLLKYLNQLGGDIILLQEIEQEDDANLIKIAAHHGFESVYSPSRITKDNKTHGLAILSKFPIEAHQTMELSPEKLHFRSRRRIAIRADIKLQNTTVRIYNIHLDTRLNTPERIDQLSPVLSAIQNDDIKTILGGDFNTAPFRMIKNIIPVSYDDQWQQIHDYLKTKKLTTKQYPKIHTFKAGPSKWRLDDIYTSQLEISDYGVFNHDRISDHFPVWADIVAPDVSYEA